MPHTKQQKKRMKKDIQLRLRNRAYKSQVKTAKKKVLGAENREDGLKALESFYKVVDTVAQKGILHKNKASRDKSKLARYVNSLK
ncbi:MAG TPA: 30S ribosomal protein S20 [Candidatus Mcinerneyibacteriales bacterium]|jgi:small subunit ribosomal protein S20|nr:30S ribosomal protein S20 [Candidatus Mcinerneyibacteriales bacterium]